MECDENLYPRVPTCLSMEDRERGKEAAARASLQYIEDGSVVGLGTGSTVAYLLPLLGKAIKGGLDLIGIPTSKQVERAAADLGIPLSTLDEHPQLDVDVDGADEVAKFDLIKGGGGALLREKIVAAASREVVIVVDQSKLVETLGETMALPVEVLPFGWNVTSKSLARLGCSPTLRLSGSRPYRTDNGNFIIDCSFGPIETPAHLEQEVWEIPGVLEHGLFLQMADVVLVGSDSGVTPLAR